MTETVCKLADLDATGARGFAVGEGEWPLQGFVVRLPTGRVRAWINRCPHAGHPLDLKPHRFLSADRQWIVCASHGAQFSPHDGTCVFGPCTGKSLQPLEVFVEGDEIKLMLGDAEKGDRS